jgi:hypothetical protein
MTIIRAAKSILSCRQTGRVRLKCKIRLDRLFPDQKSRERFDYKWKSFSRDSCNSDIYRIKGDTLLYDSEQLIPTKTNGKPSLLLVLGNPASESVKRGMFFGAKKDGKELPFWEHIIEKSGLLPPLHVKDLPAGELNKSRKNQLWNIEYDTQFRIGLSVFISIPSASGGKWSGVAGIQKLLGKAAFSLIEKEETERIISCAQKFIQNNGAVITFQKNAWENLRSENHPEYSIDKVKEGKLIGHLKGNSKIQLFGVPPTRLVGPCCEALKKVRRKIIRNYQVDKKRLIF